MLTTQTIILAREILRQYKSGVSAIILDTSYESDIDDIMEYYAESEIFSHNKPLDRVVELTKVLSTNDEGSDFYGYDIVKYSRTFNNSIVADPVAELRSMNSGFVAAAIGKIAEYGHLGKLEVLIIRGVGVFFNKQTNEKTDESQSVIQAIKKECLRNVATNVESNTTQRGKNILFLMTSTSVSNIPKDFEPFIHVQPVLPPDDKDIKKIVNDILQNDAKYKRVSINESLKNDIILALKGFREFEIRRIFAYCSKDDFDVDTKNALKIISQEKKQLLLKSGLLEWKEKSNSGIAGLDNVVAWLKKVGKAYANIDHSQDFGVDMPKGMLIGGIPGTGKSMLAGVTANMLGVPLVKMDMGRLMGQYVGLSEENLRKALTLADVLSPVVLWIDELEKGFSGAIGNASDSAVFKRMFSTFLGWLQDKSSACFVMATANNITGLPPEFLRKGRFNEKFYTFMPSEKECADIFKYHLNKKGRFQDIKTGKLVALDKLDAVLSNVLSYAAQHNKFLIGADIASIVSDAFLELLIDFEEYIAGKDLAPEENEKMKAEFNIINIEKCLINVLVATKTYSESNIQNIASAWVRLKKNNFRAASEKETLIPFDAFDDNGNLQTPGDEIKKKTGKSNLTYNEKISTVILAAIEECDFKKIWEE